MGIWAPRAPLNAPAARLGAPLAGYGRLGPNVQRHHLKGARQALYDLAWLVLGLVVAVAAVTLFNRTDPAPSWSAGLSALAIWQAIVIGAFLWAPEVIESPGEAGPWRGSSPQAS